MNVLFACGGSGGHIYPALAMAEMMRASFPKTVCAFAGRANSAESAIAQKEGLPFFEIAIDGFHRKEFCRNFRSAFLALKAPRDARTILSAFKSDLVIGTGGYVSYPFIHAAHALEIPSVLFESNAIPGLAVKLCERKASRTLLQFEECLPHLRYPEKARTIGAPLRSGFYGISREEARRRLGIPQNAFFFLSFGGSLGAAVINRTALQCMEILEKNAPHILHVHATGKRYYAQIEQAYPSFAQKKKLLPYIDDMACYMSASDLIFSRAGATTLAEIACMGRAAILVPSPNVAADHQRKNAYAFAQARAAWVMEEKSLSPASLAEKVCKLSEDRALLQSTERAAKAFAVPKTKDYFLQTVQALLGEKNTERYR